MCSRPRKKLAGKRGRVVTMATLRSLRQLPASRTGSVRISASWMFWSTMSASSLGLRDTFNTNTEADWEKLYDVNLKHVFIVTHACLDLLKKAGPGSSVISLSTIEAFRGHPLAAVYSAFKAGVTVSRAASRLNWDHSASASIRSRAGDH